MFKLIGGTVVFGFAGYGLYRWLMDRKAKEAALKAALEQAQQTQSKSE